MADGVRKTFESLIQNHFKCSSDEAEEKLEELKMQNRYIEEIFGAEE